MLTSLAAKTLSHLIGYADGMMRRHAAGQLRPDDGRTVALGQLYGELALMTERREIDPAARMLCECLIHLDRDGGALYDNASAAKWTLLANSFLPFVRTELAVLIDDMQRARPSTTEQTYAGR